MAKYEINMYSCALRRTIDITIILPTLTIANANDYQSNKISHKEYKDFPVLYLFHGYSGDHSSWNNFTSIGRYAEEHFLTVVMISGENSFYQNINKKDDFMTFIEKELPDFVTSHFPVSNKKEDTYIAGLSMGGYGAMLHGLLSPEKYNAIGSFSGALGKGIYKKHKNIMILEDILEKDIHDNKKLPNIYISIGSNDFLLEGNKEFDQLLTSYSISHYFKIVPDYQHEWAFWDKEILNFIEWLPRNDKYKDKKTVV